MISCPPVVRDYVNQFALDYLGSLRKTKQLESRYSELEIQVKRATTEELNEIARRFTNELIERVSSVEDIANLDDGFLQDALLEALEE